MVKHRHLALVAALIAWGVSMTAVAVYFVGRKSLWFGAGTAAAILGIHISLYHLALALGGTSIIGYAARWFRGRPVEGETPAPSTTGSVIHWAFRYDLLVWAISLGRERAFREKQIDLADLMPGESVLDVGCGTGTLAIAAKRRVGPAGKVYGIDASPEMIARAVKKARRAGLEMDFKAAAIESLPFPDATFDAVLSTVMLHHLPDEARRQGIHEIRRVLKPGGRLLAVDFGGSEDKRHSRTARHRNHAHFDIRRVMPELSEAGLSNLESGKVGFRDLWFVRSAAPSAPK